MKKQLFAIMFAITMFAAVSAATTWGQTSQRIQVDVPFSFTANNKVLPAGRYRIESVGDSREVWRIRGTRKQAQFLLAASIDGTSSGDLRVMFRRYGKRQFLAGFKTAAYEVSLPASRHEKSIRLAQEPSAPEEVIDLEPVTAGSR